MHKLFVAYVCKKDNTAVTYANNEISLSVRHVGIQEIHSTQEELRHKYGYTELVVLNWQWLDA